MTADYELIDLVRQYPDITAAELTVKIAGQEDPELERVVRDRCHDLIRQHKLTAADLGGEDGYELPAGLDMHVLLPEDAVDPRTVQDLDSLTLEERRVLAAALAEPAGVTLRAVVHRNAQLAANQDISKRALTARAFRAARRLYTRGLATVEKRLGGLIWVVPDRSRIAPLIARSRQQNRDPPERSFNLIKGTCKIPTDGSGPAETKKVSKPRPDPAALPKRASPERLAAVRLLTGVRMLQGEDKREIDLDFSRYLSDIDDKIIALMDGNTGETIGAEYSTRFNDLGKAAHKLDQFDAAIAQSLEDYSYATFLTLTTNPNLDDGERAEYEADQLRSLSNALRYTSGKTAAKIRKRIRHLQDPDRVPPVYDPEGFKCLYEANRQFAPCWNKFLQFLTKRKGSRPKYLAAFEYTETGLMHIHVLIFSRYLLDQKDISTEWSKLGQASVVYVYSLKNRIGPGGKRGWYWTNNRRPSAAKNFSGGDYLKKYLKKSLLAMSDNYASQAQIQSLYWAHNKRFFTCSRCFLEAKPKAPKAPTAFYFWRVLSGDEIGAVDRIVYHRAVPRTGGDGDPPAAVGPAMPGRCPA